MDTLGVFSPDLLVYDQSSEVEAHTVPPALWSHPIFSCAEPMRLGRLLGQLWGRTSLTYETSNFRNAPSASFHAIALPEIIYGHLDLHQPVTLQWIQDRNAYTILIPVVSTVTLKVGSGPAVQATPLHLLSISPKQRVQMELGIFSPVTVLRINADFLRRTVGRWRGEPWVGPLDLQPITDLTLPAALRFSQALSLISTEVLTEDSLWSQRVGTVQLSDQLLASLLWLQPAKLRAQFSPRTQSRNPVVERACDYIEEHLSTELYVEDIAQVTGVALRTLQDAFRKSLGMSPVEYIRAARLDRARLDLLSAAGNGTEISVSEVAHNWGFNHLSYFAASYRRRFGESPSQTLSR